MEKEPCALRFAGICANRLPKFTRPVFVPNRVNSGCQKSGREDLNLRPHGPEPCALAGLRYAPMPASLAPAIIPQMSQVVKYGSSDCQGHWGRIREERACSHASGLFGISGCLTVRIFQQPPQSSWVPAGMGPCACTGAKLPAGAGCAILGATTRHADSSCTSTGRIVPENRNDTKTTSHDHRR